MNKSFWFVIILFIICGSVFSQDTQDNTDLIRLLNPESLPSDPNRLQQANPTVSSTQRKLLRKVLDSISDREVDEYLLRLGLSTSGSIFAKRIRLRDALAKDDPIPKKELTEEDLLKQPEKAPVPFIIENATEGEFLSIDKTKSGVLILRGRVKLKVSEGSLTADNISVDSQRNEIYAEGGVVYKKGPMEIKGEKFIYDINLERGIIYNVNASMFPVYFVGKKIKKVDENKYLLDVAYFTACNAEVPHYSFKAKKIFVYDDKSLVATSLWYNVGGTKIFWMPLYYGTNMGSGWTFQGGHNRTQGNFFQTSYQWSEPTAVNSLIMPIGRKIKADYYQKTGQHVGFEFWKVSPWLNYNLDLGIANYQYYQIASRYTDLSRFTLGNFSDIVTTNQVDRGDKCVDINGKCFATYTDLIQTQNPNFNTRIADIGRRQQTWWKGNLVANVKKNDIANDNTKNLMLRLEHYTSPNFEYEFGYRYQPSNTLQSLYTRRTQRSMLIRQNLVWSMDYLETRKDLSVSLSARRNMTYFILNPSDRSGYFPIRDELPRLTVKNSTLVGTIPYLDAPVYWDLNLNTLITRIFGAPVKKPLIGSQTNNPTNDPWGKYRENLLRTEYFGRIESGARTNINLGAYTTFSPSVYVGANKQSVDRADTTTNPTSSDTAIDRYYKRESYQYLRQNHKLSFGIPELLLSTTYRRTDARNRELPDPVLKDGRDAVHEAEIALESNAIEDIEMSIRTIRDLRQFSSNYNPQPTDAERWYFTIFRLGAFFDFYEGALKRRSTLLERQRSFFAGIFMNNDLVYHTTQKRPLYNNATLGYQMGGFSLPFIRNIRSLEIGGTWYHVFESTYLANYGAYAPASSGVSSAYYKNTASYLDQYRFYIQANIQITKLLGLETELDSRVTQPWRYTSEVGDQAFYRNGQDPYTIAGYQGSTIYQPVDPGQDIINGTGINGSTSKQNTAFNVNRFYMILRYNIHDFEYRLGYSSDLRAIAGGPSFDSQVTFYDQSVFFSVNLLNISLGEDSSAASQTRARLYRFRKRPLDAGYSSGITGQ
ncbi:MAG: LPS-assembly protein LptD [Leptospiraceae bacterium]|nr:LPS-assembly protein LptD [Leptospiraceae bacterium]